MEGYISYVALGEAVERSAKPEIARRHVLNGGTGHASGGDTPIIACINVRAVKQL